MPFIIWLGLSLIALCAGLALIGLLAYLLPVALAVAGVAWLLRAREMRRYKADLKAGRAVSIREFGCSECEDAWQLCGPCAKAYLEANHAA